MARFLPGIAQLVRPGERAAVVNGAPGLGILDGGTLTTVLALTVSGGRVSRIDIIGVPAKLRWL